VGGILPKVSHNVGGQRLVSLAQQMQQYSPSSSLKIAVSKDCTVTGFEI